VILLRAVGLVTSKH